MSKIDPAALRADIASVTLRNADARAVEQAQADELRLRKQECSPDGLGRLLTLARFSSAIDGMPTSISFKSVSNDYLSGYGARIEGGRWRLYADDRIKWQMPHGHALDGYTGFGAHNVARSLGIAWGPEASRRFEEIFRIGTLGELRKAWPAIREALPDHSAIALAGFGSEVAGLLKLEAGHGFPDTLLDLLSLEDADAHERPFEDVPSPVERLAARGDFAFLAVLLRKYPPGTDAKGQAAFGAVSAATRRGDVRVLRLLRSYDYDFSAVVPAYGNALHVAVETAGSALAAFDLVRCLIEGGASIEAVDCHRRTPADLLQERIKAGAFEEWEIDAVLRLEAVLDEDAPSPTSFRR